MSDSVEDKDWVVIVGSMKKGNKFFTVRGSHLEVIWSGWWSVTKLINVKRRGEATFKSWNILFVPLGSSWNGGANIFFELFLQEISGIYIHEESKIYNVMFVFLPCMGIDADIVMFEQVVYFSVGADFTERHCGVNAVENRVHWFTSFLSIAFLKVESEVGVIIFSGVEGGEIFHTLSMVVEDVDRGVQCFH